MSNVFTKIGHGLEVAGKDIVKGIEYPLEFAVKAEKVLATAIEDQPELKTMLTTLVSKSAAIAASGAKDFTEGGLNLVDDAATLSLVEDLIKYVKASVVPEVEKVYGEIVADLATPVATTVTTTTTVTTPAAA